MRAAVRERCGTIHADRMCVSFGQSRRRFDAAAATPDRHAEPLTTQPARDPRTRSSILFLILPFGAMGGYLIGRDRLSIDASGRERRGSRGARRGELHSADVEVPVGADRRHHVARKRWYVLARGVIALGHFRDGCRARPTRKSLPLLYVACWSANWPSRFSRWQSRACMVYGHAARRREAARAAGSRRAISAATASAAARGCGWRRRCPTRGWRAPCSRVACALCIAALRFVPEPPPFPRSGHYGRDDARRAARTSGRSRARAPAFWRC